MLLLDDPEGLVPGAWAAQIPLLEREHRVIRYAPRAATLADRADEALAVLDALDVDRAHVLGASLGGAVALRLAVDRPERIRTLVLSGSWARSDRALRGVLASWLWTVERASSIEDVLHLVFGWTHSATSWNAGAADDEIVRAAAGRDGEWPAFRRTAETLLRSALHHDVADRLARVSAPALVTVGALDPLTPERHARELASLLPHGRLSVVADAGHQPARDQPQAFAELLLPFLAEAEPAAAAPAAAARS